jgi:phage N-6-adenine-methyltransferase
MPDGPPLSHYQVVPPLTAAEFASLAADIEVRGVQVAVELDEHGNVLDGHHRIRACRELGITWWPEVTRHGLSEAEKRRHARTLNLARRHLSGEQKRQLIADQLRETPTASDRNIAQDLGVDHHTVADVRQLMVANGEFPQPLPRVDKNGVIRVRPVPRSTFRMVPSGTATSTLGSGEVEWYTPTAILDAAREVLGGFDLDPASNAIAQQSVRAAAYYTKEDDGLSQPWRGRVWMNPPFSAGIVDKFVAKLVHHVTAGDVTAAIMLVDNRTDTQWFHQAAGACQRICFHRGRIRFMTPDGEPGASPTNGSAIVYFGPEPDLFADVFGAIGIVLRR